jgi:hypothetical protein
MKDDDIEKLINETPQIKEFVDELFKVHKEFYIFALDLAKDTDDKKLLLAKKYALKLGLPIEVKTQSGELICFYKPGESFMNAYIQSRKILLEYEELLDNSQKFSESEKLQAASELTSARLYILWENLQSELENALTNAWKLSLVDLGKKFGKSEKANLGITKIIDSITKANADKHKQKYNIGRGRGEREKTSI